MDGTRGEIDMSRLVMSDGAGIFAPDAMYDEIKKHGRWVPE
jgi:hypothetical protein